MRDRFGRRFAALSPNQRLILGMAAFLGMMLAIFAAVVLPLLLNNGTAAAEIAGQIPSRAVAGQELKMEIAVNNTGDRLLDHVCLAVTAGPGATVSRVTFQGIDTVPVTAGMACGGGLTTQETISVEVVVRPGGAGPMPVTITPTTASGAALGPTLRGTVTVTRA